MTTSPTTSLAGLPQALSPGFPSLLVHGRATDASAIGVLSAGQGFGAVLLAPSRTTPARLRTVLTHHHEVGADPGHILFDANEYSGKNRSTGAEAMDPTWIRAQLNAGTQWALTNSGFIPAGHEEALRAVLRSARGMGGQVIAALPLHHTWLQKGTSLLVEEVNAARVPVALMLEHSSDPLGARDTVRGLVRLLDEADVPVLLLRSDISVIGAVAWGAAAGAFGTSTSLRHIWPSKEGGGGYRTPQIATLIRPTMSMVSLARIGDAIAVAPDPMWNCDCPVCYGRSIAWIASETEAFQHSLAGVADIAQRVLDPNLSPAERRQSWSSMCASAQFRCMELADLTRSDWKEARFLGAWVAQRLPAMH